MRAGKLISRTPVSIYFLLRIAHIGVSRLPMQHWISKFSPLRGEIVIQIRYAKVRINCGRPYESFSKKDLFTHKQSVFRAYIEFKSVPFGIPLGYGGADISFFDPCRTFWTIPC